MTAEPHTNLLIDLNADLGEGCPHDAELLRCVSSANIACGWHAGDARTMQATVAAALRLGVAIGAHPSYPDREHFGRREMQLNPDQVRADLIYQIGALQALARAQGGRLAHVKPHGALYNQAARDAQLADAVATAVRAVDPGLALFGLAGSELILAAQRAGLTPVPEAFADRAYRADGRLVPRNEPGALIEDPDLVVQRSLRLVREGQVATISGHRVALQPQTLCLHGDGPQALALAQALRSALTHAGVRVQAPLAA